MIKVRILDYVIKEEVYNHVAKYYVFEIYDSNLFGKGVENFIDSFDTLHDAIAYVNSFII